VVSGIPAILFSGVGEATCNRFLSRMYENGLEVLKCTGHLM